MESKNIKRIIIANWKMNPYTLAEAKELFNLVKKEIKRAENIDLIIAPPVIWLGQLKTSEGDNIKLAAQNMHWEEKGAFTGEISAEMIKEAGAKAVIIGHSERRQYFGETDEMINAKIITAIRNKLEVIFCIGETLEEKTSEKTQEIIKMQIEKALENISPAVFSNSKIIIAYEPVWTIGSGETPSFDDVLSINLLVKKVLANIYSRDAADRIQILYGGSVNSLNAKNFIIKGRMDGLLVGGSSVKINDFMSIIRQLNF